MALESKKFGVRKFDPKRMQKILLFESPKLFCCIDCLEVGQEQSPHAHPESDKLYAVLEGLVVANIGDDTLTLHAGDMVMAPAGVLQCISNQGPARAAVLVFAAPNPGPEAPRKKTPGRGSILP